MRKTTVLLGLLLLCGASGLVRAPTPVEAKDDDAPRVKAWQETGPSEERVDIVFVGDGYQRSHLSRTGKYWRDVNRYARELFEERPFSSYKKLFNVYGVFLESKDAGVVGDTALRCKFNGRVLRFTDSLALVRALEPAPGADIVFVMVNTERRGGGGTVLHEVKVRGRPLPAPTFSARDTISFQTALHEVGHSFADLADEYVDEAIADRYALPKDGKDLEAANVTLAKFIDLSSRETIQKTAKWGRFLDLKGAARWEWAYQGAYYRERGVYRPFPRCRMHETGETFCPVCCEEIARSIHEASGQPWDRAAHHKKHPLRHWR